MKNKIMVINIVLIVCIAVGIFFTIKYDVIRKIENAMSRQVVQNKSDSNKEAEQEDLIYETSLDKDGNEVVIKMRKIIVLDEEGNEVEFWEDTAEHKIISDYMYKGVVEKIEGNKIYFTVDMKVKDGTEHIFENVKDYQIIFDIDSYNLESDPYVEYSAGDFLCFDGKDFFSAGELKFLVGKYLRVQDVMFEDIHVGKRYRELCFYLK